MVLVTIFAISGVALVTITTAKRLELKRQKTPKILNLIARGDTYVRDLNHRVFDYYFGSKDGLDFFFKKWVPVQTKLSFNKTVNKLKDQVGEYVNDMRDAKLLKKSDGISEFFKNIKEIEKGQGEINDIFTPEETNEEITPTVEVKIEETTPIEPAPKPIAKTTKPKRKRKVKVAVKEDVVKEDEGEIVEDQGIF